ncbi:VOC family protein [Cryobacterium sp. TMS1-13-1]|uniref:VOC family protein n=1 Tax=Cryobacterium sp. TMS1-13-1 TaxID=1259220 RepID=UPI0035112249
MARFWNSALDWTLDESTHELARLRWAAGAVHLDFVRVPEITVWPRVHLDLRRSSVMTKRPRCLGYERWARPM